jgi:hypothetical protein
MLFKTDGTYKIVIESLYFLELNSFDSTEEKIIKHVRYRNN